MVTATPCPSFPGFFASEDGRIFTDWIKDGNRLGRFTRRNWRRSTQTPVVEIQWGSPHNGYFRVNHPQLPYKHKQVHVLVLDAFSGPRPPNMVARHLDGNKANNTCSNLRWGTPLENSLDRVRHGNSGKGVAKPSLWGEKCGKAVLSENVVLKIKLLRKNCGWGSRRIGKLLGVWHSTVHAIIAGRSWKHIKI